MINREDAIKYMGDMINGTHSDATHNHYADAKTAINKIYDEFEKEIENKEKSKEENFFYFKNERRLIPFNRFPKVNFDNDKESKWVWVEIGKNRFEAFEKIQYSSYENWLKEVNNHGNMTNRILDNCNTSVTLKVQ